MRRTCQNLLEYQCPGAKSSRPNLQFGFEKWSLWIDKKKLSQINKKKLYAFTFSERTQTYGIANIALPRVVYQLGRPLAKPPWDSILSVASGGSSSTRPPAFVELDVGNFFAKTRAMSSVLAAAHRKALATLSNAKERAHISLSQRLSRNSKHTLPLLKRHLRFWLPS